MALRALEGKPAIYHCISRVVDRRFVLGNCEKDHFVSLLRTYEAFCRVRVLTFCVMSNHFHLLLEVPERPAADPDDAELLEHLRILYAGRQWEEIRWQLEHFRQQGNHEGAEQLRQRFLARMWDLSAFMQSLKQRFSAWYNRRVGRDGCLWSERFRSVLVEDGHAARMMAAYIDLNPLRAGIVKEACAYRWSGYGEAVAGRRQAREGLAWLMLEWWRQGMGEEQALRRAEAWGRVRDDYQRLMGMDEGSRARRQPGEEPTGSQDGSGGKDVRIVATPAKQVASGVLREAQLLRCRVRYFVDGLAIGSRDFVEGVFGLTRERFGPQRRSGARRLARADTGLRVLRALRIRRYGGDP